MHKYMDMPSQIHIRTDKLDAVHKILTHSHRYKCINAIDSWTCDMHTNGHTGVLRYLNTYT